jgi:lipopolysaccharide/colanic/teichoic acid biosynthesis glycosyltransferase
METIPHLKAQASQSRRHESSYLRFGKPAFDRIAGAIALLVMAPLMLAIALAIKITLGGPVFYSVQVVGKEKRPFPLFRFRTMYVQWSKAKQDAFIEQIVEDAGQSTDADARIFKLQSDPRITPVGKFLRKYSLDQLPSIFNILFGDLSLIGPRPVRLFEAARFEAEDEARFTFKPGLTGMWILNMPRSWEAWVESDKFYIEHVSPGLDFKILIRTAFSVSNPTGTS